MPLTAIILAAGKSTRMKSRRPKPLHDICGKPMLSYIFKACYGAGVNRLLVVVGHGKDEVIAQFGNDRRITWIEQTEQLGTGDAARMCQAELKKHPGDVFILAGDGPLIRSEVLQTMLRAHRDEHAAATMATAVVNDPTGYGRVVRDARGDFQAIVEQVDCTPEQREIKEIFPSYYCCRSEELLWALGKLTKNNNKGEYYLTDIFAHLRGAGKKVLAIEAVTPEDTLSINTRQQQAEVDQIMQERLQCALRESGVSIVAPESTYIEADVVIGPDTIVYPFSFIGRDSSIGAECTIGPFAMIPRNSIVREGTTIAGNVATAVLNEAG